MNYSVGPYKARYVEETLFFKTSDTLTRQRASITLDQREQWGSLQGELEFSNFLPGLDRLPSGSRRRRQRPPCAGPLAGRRGLGFAAARSARDSATRSHRRRSAAAIAPATERIRVRRSQIGLTYTFGSIFNTIVNPRFGR